MKDKRLLSILIVARWPVGGIRTFLKYLYSRFPPDKYKLFFILPYDKKLSTFKADFEGLNVEFSILPEQPSHFTFCLEVYRSLRKHKIDLIHTQGFTAGLYSIIPSKLTNIPHLMTVHFVFSKRYFTGFTGIVKKMILSVLYLMINYIHCVSNDARKNFLKNLPLLKIREKTIVALSNGVAIDRFLEGDTYDLHSELNLPENIFLIGFLGRFMPEKGFRYLVDAMELLSKKTLPGELIVVCFGWGAFIREEQAVLRDKGLESLFTFMPFQDNIAPSLRGLDVVVMPSLFEACGILAMEALVAGTPFIGTDCVGLREVMSETPCSVIPAGSARALANAVEQEMRCPRKKEFKIFKIKAAQRFDVENLVTEMKKLIKKIVLLG